MAIDRFKQLYGWGEGTLGCLGFGDGRKKMMPILLPFFEGKKIIDVGCGDNFTVVIAEVYGDPMHRESKSISADVLQGSSAQGGKKQMGAGENPYDTEVKSNRKPLCGGNDISINVRDKVLSVIQRNKMRPLSQLDGVDVAFDYESIDNASDPRLKLLTLQNGNEDFNSVRSKDTNMLPQIMTNRGLESRTFEDPLNPQGR